MMRKIKLLTIAIALFLAAGLDAYSVSLSPGISVLSSKYFDNGRVLTVGTESGKKFAGFSPFADFSLIQARGSSRDDLTLSVFLLKTGLRRRLFNVTPRNEISFSLSYGTSMTEISTDNTSESSYISWIFPSAKMTFELTQSLGLTGDFSYGYSLDESHSSMIMLGLGIEIVR